MLTTMLPALISAGANLIGGVLGRKSQEDANAANLKHQQEFAQQGVRWRVEDAKAAGVHPLAALGAQLHQFAPSVVGDTSMPGALSAAGQDISRGIAATSTASERAYSDSVKAMTLERMGLENRLLGAQIVQTQRAGLGPAFPSRVAESDTLRLGGNTIVPDPGWSDAQDIQNRYGEPAEWLYFPFVAGADIMKNIPHGEGMGVGFKPLWRPFD